MGPQIQRKLLGWDESVSLLEGCPDLGTDGDDFQGNLSWPMKSKHSRL